MEKQKIVPGIPTNIDEQNEFAYLLENNSEEKLKEDLKASAIGVKTGYSIGGIDLDLPGGAISIIAAPTSHGKTTMLINLTLGFLENNPDKCAYFLTYEESEAAILSLFINTWINKDLSTNNRASIKSFFRDGNAEYIKKDKLKEFLKEKETFFRKLIKSGRLRIKYVDESAEALCKAINYIQDNNPDVGLICIDYIQLMNSSERYHRTRQEEIKKVCLVLKDCAIETGLPLLLAAQFNREVKSIDDVRLTSIGEAGDIERIANIVIGMFNKNYEESDGDNSDEIYVKILKGRGIGAGYSDEFRFDGNTGKIKKIKEEEVPF